MTSKVLYDNKAKPFIARWLPLREHIFFSSSGYMELSEVSELFDQNVLRQLRCEAGGIKTVLRNSHQIFKGELCG